MLRYSLDEAVQVLEAGEHDDDAVTHHPGAYEFRRAASGHAHLAATPGFAIGPDVARDFVMELRELNVRPHLARNTSGRRSTGAPPGIPDTA